MMLNKNRKFILFAVVLVLIAFVLYRYSPRKIEFLGYYHKVGAHRVNDLKKLDRAAPYFDAIELDLVYMPAENNLDVHHPPADASGLTFSEYVKHLNGKQPFLWLDIKNLDTLNAERVLHLVSLALANVGYDHGKVLVETRHPQSLPRYSKEGYKTSYYLPQNLYMLSKGQLIKKIHEIEQVLKEQPGLAVSSSYRDYSILKEYFPEIPKYLWSNGHSALTDFNLIRTMLKDPTVHLVLATYRTY